MIKKLLAALAACGVVGGGIWAYRSMVAKKAAAAALATSEAEVAVAATANMMSGAVAGIKAMGAMKIGIIVGGVLLTAGIVYWFFIRKKDKAEKGEAADVSSDAPLEGEVVEPQPAPQPAKATAASNQATKATKPQAEDNGIIEGDTLGKPEAAEPHGSAAEDDVNVEATTVEETVVARRANGGMNIVESDKAVIGAVETEDSVSTCEEESPWTYSIGPDGSPVATITKKAKVQPVTEVVENLKEGAGDKSPAGPFSDGVDIGGGNHIDSGRPKPKRKVGKPRGKQRKGKKSRRNNRGSKSKRR